MPIRVAVSLGDPSGIGPEVTASALAALRGRVSPLAFGDASFERLLRRAGLDLPVVAPGDPLPRGGALVRVTRLAAADRRPGKPSPAGGAASLALPRGGLRGARGRPGPGALHRAALQGAGGRLAPRLRGPHRVARGPGRRFTFRDDAGRAPAPGRAGHEPPLAAGGDPPAHPGPDRRRRRGHLGRPAPRSRDRATPHRRGRPESPRRRGGRVRRRGGARRHPGGGAPARGRHGRPRSVPPGQRLLPGRGRRVRRGGGALPRPGAHPGEAARRGARRLRGQRDPGPPLRPHQPRSRRGLGPGRHRAASDRSMRTALRLAASIARRRGIP